MLTKQELRAHNRAFLAEDCSPHRLYRDHTSGSTGTPISIWSSRETVQAWYSLFEARWRSWYGLSRQDRWAIFGWQLVVPYRQTNPPYWVWNAALHQLYLSVFHLSAQNSAAYVDALRSHRVTYLWGYASALSVLARHVIAQGLTLPDLRCVINNAEPLYPHQREIIAHACGCPVMDTYGLAEMVCAASQCTVGRLHLWPETGIWEVLASQADTPVPSGQPGRLVGTGLLNLVMPLIRYDTGDTVVLARRQATCACGRTLPILAEISGRTDDSLITADGRIIGRLASIFKGDLCIQEAQIIQESQQCIRLRLVPAEGYTPQQGQSIAERLRQRAGEMAITVELVQRIPRGANGKFRMLISKVNQG